METIPIRSRRDPRFWAPFVVVFIVLIPSAILLSEWVTAFSDRLEALTETDPAAAKQLAEEALLTLVMGGGALSCVAGVLLFRFFQLGYAQNRLPPDGLWSLGAYQATVGQRVQLMCRIGMGLAILIPLAGISGLLFLLQFIHSL